MILRAASVVEILADKLPGLDHFLDGAQSFLAPAGALVAVSSLPDLPPATALAVGVITGAPIAGDVHLLAATTRLGSSALTLGVRRWRRRRIHRVESPKC